MSLRVLTPGLLTTVQDRGRHGHAALGVGHAGPMDAVALRLANALVGNDEDAAALEITLLGPRLHFDAATTIALAGAEFGAHLDEAALPMWRPCAVPAGAVLDLGRAVRGARGYLALAGGFAGTVVLGSRASDVNARLGPAALRAGDVVATARDTGPAQHGASRRPPPRSRATQAWSLDPRPWFDPDPAHPIRLIRGAHFDALDASSQAALFASEFRIAADSNRVGLRLDGAHLALTAPLELVSAPVAFGTLQLPPGGQPIALMAEHPTIGGYPQIGQVAAVDLPRLAQRRPGERVRFAPIDLDDAQTRYLARERALARLIERIALRLAR